MNKKFFLLLVCNGVFLICLAVRFFLPVSSGVTLYMYEDKPLVVEEVASMLKDCEVNKYVNQSTQYVYPFPKDGPWCEYVYVLRGKASRFTLYRIDRTYRINCYNLSTVVNPDYSAWEQGMIWSRIK